MGIWSPALFADDLALDVRGEYNALLSIGKTSSQAEELLCSYYQEIFDCNDPDEVVFWFALAYCQWKKGRLTEKARAKALSFVNSEIDLDRWRSVGDEKRLKKRKQLHEQIAGMLVSPSPLPKKIKKPTVHHCPWPVGSLLAYRIVTNQDLVSHPCYMKYALLRVIKIDQHPVSQLAPTECYNESMLVGLYGWIGDQIPDPQIVKDLGYIPIEERAHDKTTERIALSLLNGMENDLQGVVQQAITNAFSRQTATCAILDWLPYKERTGDITFLCCDETYQKELPAFFDTSIIGCPMVHFLPFDIMLAKRLESYLDER